MSEDFLSRWSRRKRAARRAEDGESASTPVAAPPHVAGAEPAVEQPDHPNAPADAVELTEEEIAQLPKIEDLTADCDIAAFLRKGVPETLRNAALRRMWSLDPAIRDYVGDARDYAYDWNVPGGVPGTGPLSPSEMMEALQRIEGRAALAEANLSPAEMPGSAGTASQHRDGGFCGDSSEDLTLEVSNAAAQQNRLEQNGKASDESSLSLGPGVRDGLRSEPALDAPHRNEPPREPVQVTTRSHGGAKPV